MQELVQDLVDGKNWTECVQAVRAMPKPQVSVLVEQLIQETMRAETTRMFSREQWFQIVLIKYKVLVELLVRDAFNETIVLYGEQKTVSPDLADLQKKIAELKQALENKEQELRRKIEEDKILNEKLRLESEQKKKADEVLKKQLEEKEKTNEDLKREIESRKKDLAGSEDRIKTLTSEFDKSRELGATLQRALIKTDDDVKKLRSDNERMKSEIEKIELEKSTIENTLQTLQNRHSTSNEIIVYLEKMRTRFPYFGILPHNLNDKTFTKDVKSLMLTYNSKIVSFKEEGNMFLFENKALDQLFEIKSVGGEEDKLPKIMKFKAQIMKKQYIPFNLFHTLVTFQCKKLNRKNGPEYLFEKIADFKFSEYEEAEWTIDDEVKNAFFKDQLTYNPESWFRSFDI